MGLFLNPFKMEVGIMAALVVALTELIKKYVPKHTDKMPLVAIVLAVGLMFLNEGVAFWSDTLISGLILGVTATGLYATADKFLKKR